MQSDVAIYQRARGAKIRSDPGIPLDYSELWGEVDDLYSTSTFLMPPTENLDLSKIEEYLASVQWNLFAIANYYGINMIPIWDNFCCRKLQEETNPVPVPSVSNLP